MKQILTIAIIALFSLNAQAQESGLPPVLDKIKKAVDPGSIAGLNVYDTEATLKSIKVKRGERKAEAYNLIEGYNRSIRGLKDENMTALVGFGTVVKDIIQTREFKHIWAARKDYKQDLTAMRDTQQEYHAELHRQLQEVLTRRQKRKWNKFQQELKKQRAQELTVGDLLQYSGF